MRCLTTSLMTRPATMSPVCHEDGVISLQPRQHPSNLANTPPTSPTPLQPCQHPCNLANTPATSPTRQLFNCKISCHSGQGFDYIVESPLPNAMQEHEHAPADFPGFVHVGAVDHEYVLWCRMFLTSYHRRLSTG